MRKSASPPDRHGRRRIRFAREEILVFLIAGGAAVVFLILAFAVNLTL